MLVVAAVAEMMKNVPVLNWSSAVSLLSVSTLAEVVFPALDVVRNSAIPTSRVAPSIRSKRVTAHRFRRLFFIISSICFLDIMGLCFLSGIFLLWLACFAIGLPQLGELGLERLVLIRQLLDGVRRLTHQDVALRDGGKESIALTRHVPNRPAAIDGGPLSLLQQLVGSAGDILFARERRTRWTPLGPLPGIREALLVF